MPYFDCNGPFARPAASLFLRCSRALRHAKAHLGRLTERNRRVHHSLARALLHLVFLQRHAAIRNLRIAGPAIESRQQPAERHPQRPPLRPLIAPFFHSKCSVPFAELARSAPAYPANSILPSPSKLAPVHFSSKNSAQVSCAHSLELPFERVSGLDRRSPPSRSSGSARRAIPHPRS